MERASIDNDATAVVALHTPKRISAVAASSMAGDHKLLRMLEIVCSDLDFTTGVLYRTKRDCRQLEAVATYGIREDLERRVRVFPLERLSVIASMCQGDVPLLTHADAVPDVASRLALQTGLPDSGWVMLPMRGEDRVVGILAFARPDRDVVSDEHLMILELVSYQFAAVLMNEDSRESLTATCDRLRRDLDTSHAMLRAAEKMAEQSDMRGVLQTLADVVFEETAKQTLVTLLDQQQSELVVTASAGPWTVPERRLSLHKLDPVLTQSLYERRPVVVEKAGAPSPLGMPSGRFLSVPLISDGTLIGNIEIDDPPTDPTLLSQDIRLLQGITFEAAAAIANARLHEQQVRSANVRQALNEINALLNESVDRPGLLQPMLESATRAFPADSAVIALLRKEEWIADYVLGDVDIRVGSFLDTEDVSNAQHALRAGAPLLRPEGLAERAEEAPSKHPVSLVLVVPLQLKGRVFGAMFFRRRNWLWTLDSETLDFATKLGSSVSLALGNRYLYEHEHHVSQTLQQALLSVPDKIQNLHIGHLYRGATERTRVGGDFYDMFELPDDRVFLAIGDVSGKGLDAAALTALAKNALKAHAVEGLKPHEILERTNDSIYQFSSMETFVTVFIGILCTRSGQLVYATGGHLPPVVYSNEGARLLEVDGPLLGAFPGVTATDYEATIHPGEALLLYTDGLTEARTADGDMYGEERLLAEATTLAREKTGEVPQLLVSRVEEFTGQGMSDDVAILTVRPNGKHSLWRH